MKDHKIHNELKELLEEKGKPCVSMIFPVPQGASFRRSQKIQLDHAVDKLKVLMEHLYPSSLVKDLIEKVRKLEDELDLAAGTEGIGIFISPSILRSVQFHFQVKEKLSVGDSFELRDLMFREFHEREFFLLKMSTDEVHLLKGRGHSFQEVRNKDFPAVFIDDYEYEKASRGNSFGNSLKQFEKDKSISKELRMEAFYHEVDKKLGKYLGTETPLILAGVEKDLGYFEKETTNKKFIVGKINGSYDGYNSMELKFHAFEKMKEHRIEEEDKTIKELRELFGKQLVTYGLPHVWRDAKEGKGNILVVERDLAHPGFLMENSTELYLTLPAGPHKIVNDAVDEIIKMVYGKYGNIVFTENGKLQDFEGIALIKRYV
ncbi:MAG: baeRF3 domain-containing protein [Bacteroidia bacterium]